MNPNREILPLGWQSLLLILGVAAAVSYYYLFAVGLPMLKERITLHDPEISGCALSPYRYRVLIPWLPQGMMSLSAVILPSPKLLSWFTPSWILLGFSWP
jgi:hypothetical protein